MKAVLAKLLVGCLSVAAVAGDGGVTANATGAPSSSSRSSALDPVYYVKDLFIDQIYRHIDLGYVVAVIQGPPATLGTWPTIQAILAAVAPIAACIIIGILFCVIMPIMGLCCCCCRLCNRCGGKAPYMDPPSATCKRVTCSFLLLVLTTLMLFGAVETFLSINELNKQLQNDNAGSAISQFNQRVADMFDEVSSTVNLPLQILSQLSTKVNSSVDASGASVFRNLSNVPPDFVTTMETMLNNSESGIANLSSLLARIKTAQVSVNLSQLTLCCSSSMSCNVFINANYSQFNLSLLQDGTISNARSVLQRVQDIYEVLNSSISTSTNSAKASAAAIILGQQNLLQNFSKSLEMEIESLKSKVHLETSTSDAISNFSNFVLNAGFGLGAVVAFIVLLIYLALCCGMCGRRVGEGSSSCSKGCGAGLLVAATTFMFIFSWIIMLVTLSLFPSSAFHLPCWLVDGNISKMVNSDNLDTANLSFITDGNTTFTITRLETAFSDCQSKSAYSVFASLFPEQGDVLANINKRDSWANSDLVKRLGNESITLPSNANETAESLVAIIGSLQSLAKVAMELQALGKPFTPDLDSVAVNLATTEQLCNDTRTNLTLLANDTSATLTELAGLAPIINNWLLNASGLAEHALVGLQALQKSASAGRVSMPPQVVDIIIDDLVTTANDAVVKLNRYPCKDHIYTPVTKVTDLLCSDLLDPLDAFWFSLGSSVALFVPVIIVSLYLVSLYRRQEPFKSQKDRWEDPGYHEDDGVTIRDSVPLDNMPPSRKSMQYHQDVDYSNNGYLGPHDDPRGSVPPPYYGHYNGGNGGGGAHRGGNFPRVVPNPTNSDVTYGGPPAAMAISQKRY